MASNNAVFGEYVINKKDDGTIQIFKEYTNVVGSLREMSKETNFKYDPNWNTRQFGKKFVKEFGENNMAFVNEYVVQVLPSGSVKSYKYFDDTFAALKEVANKAHFQYDSEWNTSQLGDKLIEFLNRPRVKEEVIPITKDPEPVVVNTPEPVVVDTPEPVKEEVQPEPVFPMKAPTSISKWFWVLLAIIIILLLLLLFRNCVGTNTQVKDKVVTIHDTIYVKKYLEPTDVVTVAFFTVNSAKLSDETKYALYDMANRLKQNPKLNIYVVGHASEEGEPMHNMQLSKDRADAAVDFLISQGISRDRIESDAKGSNEPKEPGNYVKNRRIEFDVKQA